jgi:hypothetical protein
MIQLANCGGRQRRDRQMEKAQTHVLVEERRCDGVHAERAGAAGGLDRFVEAGETRELEGVVRDRAHDPVHECLVRRVGKVDCREWHVSNAHAFKFPVQTTHKRRRARPWR